MVGVGEGWWYVLLFSLSRHPREETLKWFGGPKHMPGLGHCLLSCNYHMQVGGREGKGVGGVEETSLAMEKGREGWHGRQAGGGQVPLLPLSSIQMVR